MLGLCCCVRAFLSCIEWGASHSGGLFCRGARALGTQPSVAVAQGPQSTGSVAVGA